MPADRRADFRVVAVVIVLGVALFGPSLNDGFHFDDDLILADSNVTNAERWSHFFNPLRLRQVTYFTFYVNHRLGGDDAFGYHLANVGIHIANAVLLYLLLGRLVGGWPATAAALIFLAHPIQTESVLYVYQRSTLLATFFSLAALLVLARNPRAWILTVFLFLLAAASKESALAVPIVLAVVLGLRNRLAWGIASGVGAMAAFAITLLAWLGEETVGIGAADRIAPMTYFRTELGVFLTYLRLVGFPYPQALEYDIAPVTTWTNVTTLAGLAVVVALIVAGAVLIRQSGSYWTGIGIAAFLILLAPTSTVIPSADFAFEHRLYLPMLGFSLVAGIALSHVRWRQPALIAAVAVLAVGTLDRGRVWASDVALWEDTVSKAPGKARAWFNLGGAYMEAGDPRALATFSRALELDPDSVETLYNLGVVEQEAGNLSRALSWYERVLALDPDYFPAANNSGNIRFGLGQYDEARRWYTRVLAINPDYWPAQYNLAIVFNTIDRPDLAEPRLRIVLDWSPDFDEARRLLALSLQRMGRVEEAEQELEGLGPGNTMDGNPPLLGP